MRRSQFLVILVGSVVMHVQPALGCRYNVREVGFIDVGVEAYRLFVYVPQGTSVDEVRHLKATADAALADSNVRTEIVAADMDANHPASEFLAIHAITHFPAAVLVSPDGQSMPLDVTAGSLGSAVAALVDSVLHSPTRQQILDKAATTYGVALLIEGPLPGANAEAREVISTAINRVRAQLDLLPKAIARPPEVVTLDRQSLEREKLLLWSLGLKPQDVNEPHVAVFYGRGRWIGPLVEGKLLTADPLAELFLVIGADCECGLDHRFLQGTMLPVAWDADLQQKVAESVGFDPEDPVVKMEMVSIVRRGMEGLDGPGMPLGYREIEIGGDVNERPAEDDVVVPASRPAPRAANLSRTLAVSLGGMAALVAAASVAIVLRTRRR